MTQRLDTLARVLKARACSLRISIRVQRLRAMMLLLLLLPRPIGDSTIGHTCTRAESARVLVSHLHTRAKLRAIRLYA